MTIKNFSMENFYTPWSGAVSTWEKIKDANKIDDLEALINDCYPDGLDSVTSLNDLLWFDSDWVLSNLGLADDDDNDEEEE